MSSILEKIRKILAKADASRNDNANEREIAMRQAYALLNKHGLSMEDVEGASKKEESNFGDLTVVQMDVVKREWVVRIYNTIAQLNGVRMLRYTGHRPYVRFFGRAVRIEATQTIASYLIDSIYRESKPYGRASAQFALGAYIGIADQVNTILTALKNGDVADTDPGKMLPRNQAMVVVNKYMEAVDEATALMNSKVSRITTGSYQPTYKDRTAFSNGVSFGKKVAINPRVA